MAASSLTSNQIDEALYSRQIYAVGTNAMVKITNATIMVSGMNGVGVEVAKNLMLNGYKKVIIHDLEENTTSLTNYYSHLYKDIHRVKTSYLELKTLNPNVILEYSITLDYIIDLSNIDVFVLTNNIDNSIISKLNRICRENNVKFILAQTNNLIGRVFCDFGNVTISNPSGEKPITGLCIRFEIGQTETIVTTVGSKHHGLLTDDKIRFNSRFPDVYTVRFINSNQFAINYTNSPDVCIDNITFTQVKDNITINFKPFDDDPLFVITDYLDLDRPNRLHVEFNNNSNKFIPPFDYLIGGIASQEVMKGVTLETMPINQWLYLDVLDLDINYDLSDLRCFIVGAGAIGCELLKNFAMLSVGSKDGHIYITDMDLIEKSNLNRQFLFRNSDIGKPKSIVAANYVRKFNRINITAQTNKICSETEYIYNKSFFESLDVVCGALDNVNARLYVDSRCVLYKKPLLECGTLGTKGNVQVIIPFVTESYGSTSDPEEDSIPVCTIKHSPTHINHCVQWSLDLLEGLFKDKTDPMKLFEQKFVTDINELLETYPASSNFWVEGKRAPISITYDSNNEYHVGFVTSCNNILNNNTTSFEKDDDSNSHVDFLYYATCIRASQYSIDLIDRLSVKGIAGKIIPALSTTTCVIASLVAIELIRLVNKLPSKNTYVNLSIPLLAQSSPLELKEHNNFWNTMDLNENNVKTLGQLLDLFDIDNIDYINYGSIMLYSMMLSDSVIEERKNKTIIGLLDEYYNPVLEGGIIPLVVGKSDDTIVNIRYFYN